MTQLIRITDLAAMKAAGLPFKSVDAARWCQRTAKEKGLAEAFLYIAAPGAKKRNVHVDPAKFHELVRQQSVG